MRIVENAEYRKLFNLRLYRVFPLLNSYIIESLVRTVTNWQTKKH